MSKPILNKVKAIAIGTAVYLVGGLGVYLTTDVDWQAAFGPGIGGALLTVVGYGVREGFPVIIEYLQGMDDVTLTVHEVDGENFPITKEGK